MSVQNNKENVENLSVQNNKDPWEVVWKHEAKWKWVDLNKKQRIFQVWMGILRVAFLLCLLYLFIISLGLLGSAFQILGGTEAGVAFSHTKVFNNPIAGLVIGILATVLVQSSSTSTSIIITMTAAELLDVSQAVFMIMGANIGTSITNTIVSLGQVNNVDEFRRSFGAATVHDMFNFLSVIVLLPLEATTQILRRMAQSSVKSIKVQEGYEAPNFLKTITKPLTSKIISVDKGLIKKIGLAENRTVQNVIIASSKMVKWDNCKNPEKYFTYCSNSDWSDSAVGITLLIWSLILLCVTLVLIVKFLQNSLKGSVANYLHKGLNLEFPSPFTWLSDYVLLLLGIGYTILMQSSSITTSSLTPLCGVGLLRLEKMFPVTVGANVGTTFTGIMAAMGSDNLYVSLTVAFCHLFFNLFGIMIWFIVPFMRNVPIQLAKSMGNRTARHRWFAVFYILFTFLIVPALLLGLSLAGMEVMLGILIPTILIILVLGIIFFLRQKKPEILPLFLLEFYWFPKCCTNWQDWSILTHFHEWQVAKAQQKEKENAEKQNKVQHVSIIDRCYMTLGDKPKPALATPV